MRENSVYTSYIFRNNRIKNLIRYLSNQMIQLSVLKKAAALFFVVCFCTAALLQAQSQNFRHVTPRDGLPSGFIWKITEDSRGLMWIGTNTGLGKYDGYSTTAYTNDVQDSTTISGGIVYDILEYDETTFFVATDGGLNIFNPATEVFEDLSLPDSLPETSTVRDLLLINDQSMWIGSSAGLFHVDPSTIQGDNILIEFFPVPGTQGEQVSGITAIASDSLKNLWVGTDSTLFKFDMQTKSYADIGSVSDDAKQVIEGNIWSMLYTSGGDLLITSTTGLAILESDGNEIKEVKQLGEFGVNELRSASFQSVTEDSEGKIWLGTGLAGALHWDINTGEAEINRAASENNNTVASNDVHYAFEDTQGNIWFGYHYEGASIMYSESWNYDVYKPFPDLPDDDPKNTITYASFDDDGILWATTSNGLIKDLGSENQQYFPLSINSVGPLLQIKAIYDGKLFLITQSIVGSAYQTDLIVFDEENQGGQFSLLETPEDLNLTPGNATKIGNFYYSGVFNSNKIVRLDLENGEMQTTDLPVQGEYPEALLSASAPQFIQDNELYVQIYFIAIPSGEKFEGFIIDLETGEIRAQNIVIDTTILGLQPPLVSSYEQGVVYLNTASGLFRIDNLNSSYTVLFEDQVSLLREGSLLMTEDEEGYIWLNNLTGLTRLDPLTESLEYFEVPRDEYVTSRAFPVTLSNGEILFPGNSSYIRFNPADLRGTQPDGETLITSMQAGNDEYNLVYNELEPEIESYQNTLTFNFLGIDMRNPSSVNYRYRILGSDNEQWTQVGTQRSVFIPNLSPGNYKFEVQSGSQFGSFDGQMASVSFSVLPPWWNTYPAYLVYLFLIAALVAGLARYQKKRVLDKERERAREKELAQAREIEKAYENLKAAQEQLVQQEKLASLGQLTAGIAHEIKNTLNFVNNFSDLSIELIQEIKEDLNSVSKNIPDDDREKIEEALDALTDVDGNLKKIYQHGSRADSIVKSMLQHSRGGSGKPEPTDLNALIREYANLSFHGMRAGEDPINVDIDLQLDDSIDKVPLVAEDFSRVILNLCNNAFDAMREKIKLKNENGSDVENASHSKSEPYLPKITVRTFKDNGSVMVEVEDNGPGIPKGIKEQILQPFFTTKKGTQGTGLGLSITNDIIKAHGGRLDVESVPGELTRFKILISKN